MPTSPRTAKTALALVGALALAAPSAASARSADAQLVRAPAPIQHVAAPTAPTVAPMSAAMMARRTGTPFVRTVTPAHGAAGAVVSAPAPQATGDGVDWTLDGLLAGGALLLTALGGVWLRQRRPGPRSTATLAG